MTRSYVGNASSIRGTWLIVRCQTNVIPRYRGAVHDSFTLERCDWTKEDMRNDDILTWTKNHDILTWTNHDMRWLRLVGSFKWLVSFPEYCLFYRALLQKRPIILWSLLIVATPICGVTLKNECDTHVIRRWCVILRWCVSRCNMCMLYSVECGSPISKARGVAHDLFTCVFWIIHVCYAGICICMCVGICIRICVCYSQSNSGLGYRCAAQDSFIRVSWLIHVCYAVVHTCIYQYICICISTRGLQSKVGLRPRSCVNHRVPLVPTHMIKETYISDKRDLCICQSNVGLGCWRRGGFYSRALPESANVEGGWCGSVKRGGTPRVSDGVFADGELAGRDRGGCI